MKFPAIKGCLLALLLTPTATLLLTAVATAGAVSLATAPLNAGLSKFVPPNLFVVIDDSISTASEHMPDGVSVNLQEKCYLNWGHNKLAYNPAVTYSAPPSGVAGQFLPNSSYNAAWNDGYRRYSYDVTDLSIPKTTTSPIRSELSPNPFAVTNNSKLVVVTHFAHGYASGTVVTFTNLRSSTGRSRTSVGGIPIADTADVKRSFVITVVDANHYTFLGGTVGTSTTTGGGTAPIATTFVTVSLPASYAEYTAAPDSPPATCESNAAYTNKTPTTSAEKTNFANWYSYYRSRSLTLKSTIGRAFASLDSNFRVGYSAANYRGTSEDDEIPFRRIREFSSINKKNWYDSFYKVAPTGGATPLRAALSKAGRMYAGTLPPLVGNYDPVLYSCQQNFTLLVTDGYWTIGGETPIYGPFKMDGTTSVGDQDGDRAKFRAPYLDEWNVANSLADMSSYYYNTDLRTAGQTGGKTDAYGTYLDVSVNNVPAVNSDRANWQHMNTFALGLGVNGELGYSPSYLTGGSAAYNAILGGSKRWPNPDPTNVGGQIAARIDDLWHAAVNGHGQYFSANNPDQVVTSLQTMLAAISRSSYSAAAAATSSLEPVTGNNYAYVAQFTNGTWSGDLTARTIDINTGALSVNPIWSAATLLASRVSASSDDRRIYTYSASATNKLKEFTPANLSTEKSAAYFSANSSGSHSALSQYAALSGDARNKANTQDNLIYWIRGRTGSEDIDANAADSRVYRARSSVMADIVNSSPVFVKQPPFSYVDAGYAAFYTAQKNRQGMVYVNANDGMLHAFNADTGAEVWAYIPTQAIPYLYKLADFDYANRHQFLLDGQITVGDIYDTTAAKWRTILVGMMGSGGRGLFALDITDPNEPIALWQFTNSTDGDLGYTLGNALITKRHADGKWVVAFASGYNNSNSSSGNDARLYVVDAVTGSRYAGTVGEIVATEFTTDQDSTGIARISAHVESSKTNNTARYVYGGNLAGTLFRFDLDTGVAQMLGHTSTVAGDLPITTRPEIATVTTSTETFRVVYIGTGRYLGSEDLNTTSTSATKSQAIFAFKDTGADLGSLQSAGAGLVQQTLDSTTTPSTIPNPQPVDWSVKNGWYVKLPIGERINVDPKLQVGSLVAVSNRPIDDYCYSGGSSTQYVLGFRNGTAISTQERKTVGTPVGPSLATGVAVIKLPTGKVMSIITESDTTVTTGSLPVDPNMGLTLRRVSWKELL